MREDDAGCISASDYLDQLQRGEHPTEELCDCDLCAMFMSVQMARTLTLKMQRKLVGEPQRILLSRPLEPGI